MNDIDKDEILALCQKIEELKNRTQESIFEDALRWLNLDSP